MENYSPEWFGRLAADYYDGFLVQRDPPSGVAIESLVRLSGPSRCILEIGAGTGRFAIPLARAGLTVTAVDISEPMLSKLVERAAAEGVQVQTHVVDATVELPDGEYGAVGYLFNTFFMIGDRIRQRDSLRLASDRLRPGGYVVVEAFIPTDAMFGEGRSSDVRVLRITPDSLVLAARVVTKDKQTVDVQEVVIADGQVRLVPHVMNYLSLAELDSLCSEASLELVERWNDWDGQPVRPESKNAISLYRKAT